MVRVGPPLSARPAGSSLGSTAVLFAEPVTVGAIRWDAWVGLSNAVGAAVEKTLSPAQYHYRVPFYGEETGRSQMDAESVWLVDPIDGTKSFVRECPFFSTQIALMRGGIGSDAEVREIVEESRAVIIDRSIADLPLRSKPTTLLRLAMEGWVGYVEATSLSWLERRTVPRVQLRELLFNTFLVVVGAAVQADPSLELDLAAMSG